ncbi:MAG: peptide chain release factor N(5)-glutamine methyltransferase [Candidatus Fermentibacteraceae bacterium]|nr:peptide chain release factor N(5)-glutamine methyltransferase [Candidatus Fermentibacteraceae bacterium]
MTVADIVASAAGKLKVAGFVDSVWQARVLAAHVLSLKPAQLYAADNQQLNLSAQIKYFILLNRRLSGIPLQQVIGEWDFYGRTFKVDGRALVPRPETELLVDFITSCNLPVKPRIADIGTGSGIIGISLALEIPLSTVTGTDISTQALELAAENARLLSAENYSTLNCNLTDALTGKYDVIVANLPYIPTGEISVLQPEVKNYDPAVALDGGIDGTLLILELVKKTPDKLKPGGLIVLETGDDQKNTVSGFFAGGLWAEVREHDDLAGKHRMVTARRR